MSVEITEVRTFLAAHEPFARLPGAELDALPARLTMRYARRGEVFVEPGAPNDFLYVIRSGAVDIMDADGVLLDRRDAGQCFGYSTLVGKNSSRYRMEAVEDSLVLALQRTDFAELAQRHPDVDRYFSSQSRRIRAEAKKLTDTEHAEILRQRVTDLPLQEPVTAAAEEGIADAARRMTEHNVSCLVVTDPADGSALGIVTDRDLRARVVAAGIDPAQPLSTVMTAPVATVRPDSLVMEALLVMAEKSIHHVPVVDGKQVVAVLLQADIARTLQEDPLYVAADFHRCESGSELAAAFAHSRQLAARYVRRNASPQETAGVLTLGADALARRLCTLAERELGAPPVDYAFVAVGSQGRREVGFASDQDNALVLAGDYDESRHGEYFARFSEFVCQGLADAGQPLCPGDMMASNPEWRMPVGAWDATFRRWVQAPQPDALLHAQVFFDLRAVAGSAELAAGVHRGAVAAGQASRRTHAHLASLAARREPPLTFFKGFVVDRSGDYAHTLDVKKGGVAAVVQMARLYALVSGSTAVDTRSRLADAAGQSVSQQGAADLCDAFDYLTSITLEHQAGQHARGEEPDYHLSPKELSRNQREHLRDAFQIIKGQQNALATRYPVRNI